MRGSSASLGTGAIAPMLVFFLQQNLSTTASNLGILTACFGAGSVVGALASGRLASWVGARALTWTGLLASGLLLATFARQATFGVACAVLFAVGLPVAALNAGLSPQLLAVTPPAFRGRVMGVLTPANTAASMISLLLAGLLASTALEGFHRDLGWVRFGPIDTILTGSAVLILMAGLLGMLTLPPTGAGARHDDPVTMRTPEAPTGT